MMTISVIVGSTRQGRFSEKPAQWILQQLQKREGIEARLLDLRDFPMPFFDQPMPPAMPGRPPYEHEVVKKWTPKSRPRMVLYSSRRNTTTAPPRC
jgi:NAD(P)H-dependent FMN reductase